MAYEQSNGVIITLEAAEDLSAKQYNFVKLDANGKVVITAVATAGQIPIGVLQNAPESGEAAMLSVNQSRQARQMITSLRQSTALHRQFSKELSYAYYNLRSAC